MSGALFPLSFSSEEFRLLSGLVAGILFGFALERGGFGNARKLAAQFYLYDMTVFKVMFTAILVAMVGIFGLDALGVADINMMWINLNYLPAQVIGGLLLGVGFIMSGLCPGTSVVSMVSGRIDAWVTFAGIFAGLAGFVFAVDLVPGLATLYGAGSGEVSLLPQLLGVPALVVVVVMVVGATLAFIGAEKVEAIFGKNRAAVELTPRSQPRAKLVLGGSLAVMAMLALAFTAPRPELPSIQMASVAPMSLAEALIRRDPGILVLDLRTDPEADRGIPGSVHSPTVEAAQELLAKTPPRTTVVVVDESGSVKEVPGTWPRTMDYRVLEGGLGAWNSQVLTPMELTGASLEEQEEVLVQNQIAAFFSGAAVQATSVMAPPPAMATGGKKKKKTGGC